MMMIRDVGILGIGIWEGDVITNDYFSNRISAVQIRDPFEGRCTDRGTIRIMGIELSREKHRRAIAALERSLRDPFRGARRRRFFPPQLQVSDAETEAAQKAIAEAGIRPTDIDVILVQSFLPDQLQPKNGALIAHKLGIHAPAWEVDGLCNSSITQAQVGAALIQSGQARHVLCVQSVAYSRANDPGTSFSMVVGDMASAFVLGQRSGARLSFGWHTEGRLHGAVSLQWSTPVNRERRRYWEASQERLLHHFDEGTDVMQEIAQHAEPLCRQALRRADIRPDEIDVFISHHPVSWFPWYMLDVLNLPDETLCNTFEEYGNVSSSSIPVTLHAAAAAGRLGAGRNVLVFGPAAGFLFGAMVIRW